MTPRNRDVIDPQIRFMTSAEFELHFVVFNNNCVHEPRIILVIGEWLDNDIRSFGVLWSMEVDHLPSFPSVLKSVRESSFAEFALKLFPRLRYCRSVLYFLNLRLHPGFQAVEVDIADRSRALTNTNFRVVFSFFLWPAESAGGLFVLFSFGVLEVFNIVMLARLIILVFLILWSVFLHSELDSTKFKDVVPLDLVILLSEHFRAYHRLAIIFQTTNHKPHSIVQVLSELVVTQDKLVYGMRGRRYHSIFLIRRAPILWDPPYILQ